MNSLQTAKTTLRKRLDNYSNLKIAIGYASVFKWSVFPVHSIIGGHCSCNRTECSSPGKHPRTQNGVHAATKNIEKIKAWWQQWPESNVGIATGSKSGFFVLDVDVHNNGFTSLKKLEKKFGPLPLTVTAITGGNGRHYLFKHQSWITNKTNLFPGIDIRGENGYIVVYPSSHISGGQYRWVNHNLRNVPIAPPPIWLTNILNSSSKLQKRKPNGYWKDKILGVSKGERNNVTAQLAGYLLHHKIPADVVYEILLMWNERCHPPQKIDSVERTFESILKKVQKERN